MADWKKQHSKHAQQSYVSVDTLMSDTVIFGTQTRLTHPDRRSTKQLETESYQESETTFPDLQEYTSTGNRWLQGEDNSTDDEECMEPRKQAPYQNEASSLRFSSSKLLPRISDPRRPRRAFFSECQSLYDKIKSSCSATSFNAPRRSSYSGIGGDDDDVFEEAKPSIQGMAIWRKGKGERAQLIDADNFSPSAKESPIQRVLDFKKPNLTPWSKSKPLTGRPQSGQTRFVTKTATDYGTMNMACIGSRIKTDLSPTVDNKSQNTVTRLRNLRAKSASIVAKSRPT